MIKKIFLLLFMHSLSHPMEQPSPWSINDYPESIGNVVGLNTPQFTRVSKQEQKQQRKQRHDELLALATTLIDQKLDLNLPLKEKPFTGKTILTAAATHRTFRDILEIALKANANPNMPDGHNQTPLKVAVTSYCRPAFRSLVKGGAIAIGQGLVQEICNPHYDRLTMRMAFKRIDMLDTLLFTKCVTEAISKQLANEIDEHENNALFHLLCNFTPCGSQELEDFSPEEQEAFYMQRKIMMSRLLDAGINPAHVNRKGKNTLEEINSHDILKNHQLVNFLLQRVQKSTP